MERFWWPLMRQDIAWFICSYYLYQIWQTCNVLIPPVIALLAPLFPKMYMDTMYMPTAGGFWYLVQGQCSILHYPKFCMLHNKTSTTLANWIFEDIICQWSTLVKIVSNNRPAFIKLLCLQWALLHVLIGHFRSCDLFLFILCRVYLILSLYLLTKHCFVSWP